MRLRRRTTLFFKGSDGSRLAVNVPIDMAHKANVAFKDWTPDQPSLPERVWWYLFPRLKRLAWSVLIGAIFWVTAVLLQAIGITHTLEPFTVFLYTTTGCYVGMGMR